MSEKALILHEKDAAKFIRAMFPKFDFSFTYISRLNMFRVAVQICDNDNLYCLSEDGNFFEVYIKAFKFCKETQIKLNKKG